MSDAGMYGSGFDPMVIQLLLPLLAGMGYKDQSNAFQLQNKGTDNINDLIRLLMSPEFGMFTGTYDPMLAAGEAPSPFVDSTPMTLRYMNSGNPVIANVAAGLLSGEYDALSAKQVLRAEAEKGTLTGFDTTTLDSAVDSMYDEIVKNDAARSAHEAQATAGGPRNDPYAKAGLPSPLEQYQAGYDAQGNFVSNMGIEDPFTAKLASTAPSAVQDAQDRLSKFKAENPLYTGPGGGSAAANESEKLRAAADEAKARAALPGRVLTADEVKAMMSKFDPARFGGFNIDAASLAGPDGQVNLSDLKAEFKRQWSGGRPGTSNALDTYLNELFTSAEKDGRNAAKTAAEWSGRGAQYADRVSGFDAGRGVQLERDVVKAQRAKTSAEGRQIGASLAARDSGRSPLQDAMRQRLAMLRAAGLV